MQVEVEHDTDSIEYVILRPIAEIRQIFALPFLDVFPSLYISASCCYCFECKKKLCICVAHRVVFVFFVQRVEFVHLLKELLFEIVTSAKQK
jgi:hypothetical protein